MIDDHLHKLKEDRQLSDSSVEAYRIELMVFERLIQNNVCLADYLDVQAPSTRERKLVIWKRYAKTIGINLDHLRSRRIKNIPEPKYLTDEELQSLISNSNGELKLFIELGGRIGLRLSEILQVDRASVYGENIKVIRKGGKLQTLPCPSDLIARLRDFDGFQYSKKYYQAEMKKLGIHAHTLRHTFASSVIKRGFPVTELKEFLGHRSITTTLRYVHMEPEHLRRLIK